MFVPYDDDDVVFYGHYLTEYGGVICYHIIYSINKFKYGTDYEVQGYVRMMMFSFSISNGYRVRCLFEQFSAILLSLKNKVHMCFCYWHFLCIFFTIL
jgi:hypothetical protein